MWYFYKQQQNISNSRFKQNASLVFKEYNCDYINLNNLFHYLQQSDKYSEEYKNACAFIPLKCLNWHYFYCNAFNDSFLKCQQHIMQNCSQLKKLI